MKRHEGNEMPKKSADSVVRRFNTMLPCRLTEDELRERGSALAHAREAHERFEGEAAEARKKLKEQAELLDGDVSRLARIVRDRSEHREVTVEVRLTAKAGMVDEVRTDTGEVIANRKIADREAQADMLDAPAAYAALRPQEHEA
jgi:hypothetical protein